MMMSTENCDPLTPPRTGQIELSTPIKKTNYATDSNSPDISIYLMELFYRYLSKGEENTDFLLLQDLSKVWADLLVEKIETL
jgi:hypothetical protein